MRKLKVLVAGADSTTYTVLNKIKQNENIETLYSLPYNRELSKLSNNVDIRENDVNSIIEFVKANGIDLTIVTSPILTVNGIANAFEQSGLTIFAPQREAAIVTCFNAAAKKTMYKLKIPTTRFAVFDKLQNALPYLRQMHFPVSVSPDFKILTAQKRECKYFSQAKKVVDDLFYDGEERVVAEENNQNLKEYNLYFLTDGYSSYFFGSCEYDQNGICISPSPDLGEELIRKIERDVVLRLLEDINNFSSPYAGILGVKIRASGNYYKVIDFMSVFEKCDFEAILPSLESDLLELYYAAATGSLSDDFKGIYFNDKYSCSQLVTNINVENSVEDNIAYTPVDDETGILTSTASTVSEAKNRLLIYSELNDEEVLI